MAQPKGVEKWKAKQWFNVHAPPVFKDVSIGEMPANDEEAAVGRNIIVSLDQLTKNPSHAYTNVVLKVTEAKGEAAQTRIVRLELVPSYIRSFVRRYRSVSTGVVNAKTKDGRPVIVKLIVVTKQRTAATKIVGIRREMTQFTKAYCTENDLDALITAVTEGKFQAEMGSKLNHITDLNKVEVRKLEVEAA